MFAGERSKDRNVARAMPASAVDGIYGGREVVLSRAKSALRFIAVCFKKVF